MSTPAPEPEVGARFEVYPDQAGQWRFRLVAANGEIVAHGEAYVSPSNARRAVNRIRAIVPRAELRLVGPAPADPEVPS